MDAFLTGIAAGYGIAIPVGAIAILIIDVGIRCGFTCAFFAGAGAASADLLYAALAVVAGAALAGPIGSVQTPLRFASAAVLAVIAVSGLRRAGRERKADISPAPSPGELARTYGRFLGLTIINPTTVVYFGAVIIGLGIGAGMTPRTGMVFVAGAFLASLSWQSLLAGFGAFAGGRLSPRARKVTAMAGNLLILVLAVAILVR